MNSPDILFALTGDVHRNSRALRQLDMLAEMGLQTDVLTFGNALDERALPENFHLRMIPRPSGSGPAFFAGMHRRMKTEALSTPARIYHASDLYVLPALHAAAGKHDGRLAYDARECYPHVASTEGRPWVRRFWHEVEKRYARRADAVFTVSESIAAHMASAYEIERPNVLYNAPRALPLEQAESEPQTPRPQRVEPPGILRKWTRLPPETSILLHQGSMQQSRGCALLVEAMQEVAGGALVFLGKGPLRPELETQVQKAGLQDRIFFFDPVPPGELLPVTASADAGITLLEDTCLNHRYALPNKLFEYLAAGLPVLGSDLPEIRRVLTFHGAGLLVNPADHAALVRSLRRLVDERDTRRKLAARARATLETFSAEESSNRFQDAYKRLLLD